MTQLFIPRPNEKQRLFFADTHRYVAFGGARGGGKSWAVRIKAALMALKYPGIKIMIVRRTYPELRANHILPLTETLSGIARYHETAKEFRFPNGSRIMFRHCQSERDVDRYQGTETDVLFLDEATQLTQMQFTRICTCVRGANGFPKRIYITCNPGGVGHSWVKRLFIERNYREGENPGDYSFIKSLVTDNYALLRQDKNYVRQLQQLPEKLKKAWLYGDWNIFEGQFFEEFSDRSEHYFDRRWTHVIEPFDIPREWTVYRSFDFGYSRPFSCDWWAVDGDGRAYLFRQYYGWNGNPNEGSRLDPNRIFQEIKKIESADRRLCRKKIIGIADPSIWDASRGESVAECAAKNGIMFSRGDNSRLAGWMQCHARFAFDTEGYPRVYFFRNCEHAIRTIPLLQYSKTDAEDLDTSQEDHFADSFRYFCMSRPIKPQPAITAVIRGDDPLDLYKSSR